MKKILASLLLIVALVVPNTVFAASAQANNYGTIIWEGTLANTNYGGDAAKIRITITGVVGEQVSAGKVNTYEKLLSLTTFGGPIPQVIIPVVDGGSIKVEYLGEDAGKTYQDTEGSLGMTIVREISQREYGDKKDYVDDSVYIDYSEFYVNDKFMHIVGEDRPVEYSELSYDHLKNKNYIGKIYIPVESSLLAETNIQIVSESEAQQMMEEIKEGHPVRLIGKTFEQAVSQEDNWQPIMPEVNKSVLEDKYGIQISMEQGFLSEQVALNMVDTMFGRFPEGLIKEVTSYYKARGKQTHVKFVYRQTHLSGSFSDEGSQITLYYYPSGVGGFGDWVIAHEMGHYIHKYLNDRYGYDKLYSEWISLNNGLAYGSEWDNDRHSQYFVRDYGLTSYSEDVATLFEWLTADVNNYELRARYVEDEPIRKKFDLLNRMLSETTSSVNSLDGIWGTMYPQNPSSYAVEPVSNAVEAGIIPDDSKFLAIYQSNITREDFSLLAINVIEQATGMSIADYAAQKGLKKDWYYEGTISGGGEYRVRSNYPFSDISNGAVFDLHTLGVINGIGNKLFDPNGYLTREQAAVIMYQLAIALDQDVSASGSSFSDGHTISSWAKNGVDYVSSAGIMLGTGHNAFSPKQPLSYEQSYIMLHRLFAGLE